MKFSFRDPKILFSVNIALGILLILAAIFFARDIVSLSMRHEKKTTGSGKKVEQVSKTSFQEYAPILKNNPFGFPGGELKVLSASSAPLVSRTDLFLIGTISGSKKVSYAIFADKKGVQEIFNIGESVFGLGILDKVEKDRVFIDDSGQKIEIPMFEWESGKDFRKVGKETVSYSNIAQQTSGDSYLLNQKKVLEAIEHPNQFMTDARLQPHVVEGRQEGFILKEVKPGGIYDSIGLQDEDVLLRINEFSIDKPESALQAFTALKGMDRIQLDIVRDGAKASLTYQMR